MKLLYTLALSACTGAVSPGLPLTSTSEQSAAAGDAGVPCVLDEDATWTVQLTRMDGDCDDVVSLELLAAGETHLRFAGCVGYGDYALSNGACVATFDAQCADQHVVGWAQPTSAGWAGSASVSRAECSGIYDVREVQEGL